VLITDVWYAGRVRAAAAPGVAREADVEADATPAGAVPAEPEPADAPEPADSGRISDAD
jgi:hypothetical protein